MELSAKENKQIQDKIASLQCSGSKRNQPTHKEIACVSLAKLMRTLTSKSWTLQIWSHCALDDHFSVIAFSGIWLGESPIPPPTTSNKWRIAQLCLQQLFYSILQWLQKLFSYVLSYVCSTKHCME